MVYEKQRNAAIQAALDAARVIRFHAGRLDVHDVEEKGIHDLVTVADREAERVIFERLEAAFPAYGFLGEEGTRSAGDQGSDAARWIVDPVDGTTNFAHQCPPYAVSIALQEGPDIVVGLVYELGRDELFTATKGGGAFRNGVPIRVSKRRELGEALLTTGFPFREYELIDAYLATLRRFMLDARGVRRPGSAAADLANVACGRMEGFFEVGLSSWDSAAGALLIEEAGGRVTDLGGGGDWLFGRQIVASNGLIHDAMLERVDILRRLLSLQRP